MRKSKTVWMPVLMMIGLMAAANATAQTAEAGITKKELIAKAWKAMFGERKDADIQSLYVEGYFHGKSAPSRMTVKRPNLFRNEIQSGVLVFDGRRAAWARREPDKDGKAQGPELLPPAHWKHFELDIALLFPAFFDHPAELRGSEKVNGHEAHILFVRLPLGASVTYFVDSQSYLITKRLVRWEGDADMGPWENMLGEYVDVGGIRYPDSYSFQGREGQEKGMYSNVRINIDPADELFQLPAELL
jgi:hypothetical protein